MVCTGRRRYRSDPGLQLNGEIIRKTGMTEETVVPVKTAAGLTKTMAPRREDTIVKEDLPKVSGDIADFHRNVVAVIRDGAEPEIKLFQVMRVMKLMERSSGQRRQTR
mgnify:CR=1 FL=1